MDPITERVETDGWVEGVLARLDEHGALAQALSPEEQVKQYSDIIGKLGRAYAGQRQRLDSLLRELQGLRDENKELRRQGNSLRDIARSQYNLGRNDADTRLREENKRLREELEVTKNEGRNAALARENHSLREENERLWEIEAAAGEYFAWDAPANLRQVRNSTSGYQARQNLRIALQGPETEKEA